MGSRLARIYSVLEKAIVILSSIAWTVSPVLMIIYAASQILFLALPLYILRGDAEGYLGVLSYRLEIFQNQVRSPALDSLSVVAIPVIISILIAIIAILSRFTRWEARSWVALGGAGIAVMASGISIGLRGVVSLVASQAARNYGHATSAGYIYFQGVDLSGTIALAMPIIAYFSSIAAMILMAVHIIFKPERRSTRISKPR